MEANNGQRPGVSSDAANNPPIDLEPTGTAVPIPRHPPMPGGIVVPRGVVYGIVGFALGVGVAIWALSLTRDRR